MKKNTGIPRAAVAGLALCAVLLTGCTLRPPYAIDAYARGDMDVQAK